MSKDPVRRDLIRFLARLGQAELVAGNAAALIERDLGQIAKRNGVEHITVSVLPTVMFIQFDDGEEQSLRLALGPYRAGSLRFDQIEGVLQIARDARSGKLSPSEGLRKLDAVWRMKHRYGDVGFVLGYLITTVGVGLMLRPTWEALGVVSVLGLICALLLVVVRRQPAWNAVMPVVASFILAACVGLAYRLGVTAPAMDLLIPPLIVFLPGSVLTVAIVELAFANIVSGATRLVAGFTQLILLAFGLLGGFRTFDPGDRVTTVVDPVRLGWWVPWVGVLLFAIGLHLYKSSRQRSVWWMMLTMAMAYAGQTVSGLVMEGVSTAFFGAVLMMLTALAIEHRFKGPPALITFLPAFWLLAPGSFGLVSVAGIATDQGTAANILTLFFTLVAIATGCLIGAFLYSGLYQARRSLWWKKDPLVRTAELEPPDRFPGP
ncbi:MAG TPA: threonine/serine exporter family protein [Flavobacteriales bacterium]